VAARCKWQKVRGANQWAMRTKERQGVLVHHELRARGNGLKKVWVVRQYKDIYHPFKDVSKLVGTQFKSAAAAKAYVEKKYCEEKR